MIKPKLIHSLRDAISYFQDTFAVHPERDGIAAYAAVMAGKKRKYPAIALDHLIVPGDAFEPDGELELPAVAMPEGPEAELARTIVSMLSPLKMLNPVCPVFYLGRGPGTLAASFGAELDPGAGYQVKQTRTMSQLLELPPPDVESAGLLPEMRQRIALIKNLTPDTFKIAMPDMQGPFNLAHSLAGEEALIGPHVEPEKFHALMTRITDYWIAVHRLLEIWIGGNRRYPRSHPPCIGECSVNLVSPEFYTCFILEHDRRIAEAFGPLHIHPCSGPHVFKVTLENLPVAQTEAGYVAKAAAGAILVNEAMQLIAGRPIALLIGQEPAETPLVAAHNDDLAGRPCQYKRHRDEFECWYYGASRLGAEKWREVTSLYYAYTTMIDDQVSRLLTELDRLGISDNTVVIFTTDHGNLCGARGGLYDKGVAMFEDTYHIPLLVRWPGVVRAGSRMSCLVSNMDIFSTILEIAGAKTPEDVDSRSLVPVLENGQADWHEDLMSWSSGAYYLHSQRMLRWKHYKYVFTPYDTDELYNLADDPLEIRNLIAETTMADVRTEMRRRLIRAAEICADPLAHVMHGYFRG